MAKVERSGGVGWISDYLRYRDISPPISSACLESYFDDGNGSSWTSSFFRSPGSDRKVGRDELEGSA
jgi:hypothetical protein